MTCRCDKATWTEDQGPVCGSFTSGVPEYHRGMCISCFHDEACHRPWTEAEIRADERKKVIAQIRAFLNK